MPTSADYALSCEVFLVPWDGQYLLYAPVKGLVAAVNPAAACLVRDLEQGEPFDLTEAEHALADQLADIGVVNGEPDPRLFVFEGQPFQPIHTTLFLTNACNLRCLYCYAEGGELETSVIPDAAARAAIDFVADNALRREVAAFSVGFHGAGEPTVAWRTYTRLVRYAQARADALGLRVTPSTATNGVLTERQACWMARHTTSANLSVDGPADVQDLQRPRVDGSGSFEHVARTMRVFDAEGFSYAIRATITELNVHRMAEMVEFFADEFHPQQLQFDPLIVSGRCRRVGWRPPEDDLFVEEFLRAFRVGQERGILVGFSSVGFSGYRTYFCAAAADGFTVTHEGYVTACFEAYSPTRPFGDRFVYGRYDEATGTFDLDLEKLAQLQKRHVYNLPYCERCFCKYMCAGDCPIHALYQHSDAEHGLRCQAVQEVARHRLALILRDQEVRAHG